MKFFALLLFVAITSCGGSSSTDPTADVPSKARSALDTKSGSSSREGRLPDPHERPGAKADFDSGRLGSFGFIVRLKSSPIVTQTPSSNGAALTAIASAQTLALSDFERILGRSLPTEQILARYRMLISGFALQISATEAQALRASPYVADIVPNWIYHTRDDSVHDRLPSRRAGRPRIPYTGRGVRIAIVDTGIDYTHPDLGGCAGVGGSCAKVIGGYDFVTCDAFQAEDEPEMSCLFPRNEDADPYDDHGHGTHVAAIAAGNGSLRGVAYEASLLAYKVVNSQGEAPESWILSGMERATDPNNDGDPADHVDIMNISLGGPPNLPGPDLLAQSLDRAVDAGVVAVVAAGNDGAYKTIASPGTAEKAITVGATDGLTVLADFSSRGPADVSTFDLKPDVVAPGVGICAARAHSSYFDRFCNGDEGHVALSGTSMATPYVAGAVALIKQARPALTPVEVKSALRLTAETGAGAIDYRGHTEIGAPDPAHPVNTTEFCTAIDVPTSLPSAKAIFDPWYTNLYLRDLATMNLRPDVNGSPGLTPLQSIPWKLVDTHTEGDFSAIQRGSYWLCVAFRRPVTLLTLDAASDPISASIRDRIWDGGAFVMPNTPSPNIFSWLLLEMALPATPFEVGAGAIHLGRAVGPLISAPSSNLHFGLVEPGATMDRSITLRNLTGVSLASVISVSTAKRTLDLRKETTDDTVAYMPLAVLSPPSALPPNALSTIEFRLSVPSDAPNGYYSGRIDITENGVPYSLPYSFMVVAERVGVVPIEGASVTVDGHVNAAEWADGFKEEHLGTEGRVQLYAKLSRVSSPRVLLLGIKVSQPVEEIELYLDEGDDGQAGSGSFDRVLTLFQEDTRGIILGEYSDSYFVDGFYFLDWLKNWEFDPEFVDFRAAVVPAGEGTEAEFAIPLLGNDEVYDFPFDPYSGQDNDLRANLGDSIGIGLTASRLDPETGEEVQVSLPEDLDVYDAMTYRLKLKLGP